MPPKKPAPATHHTVLHAGTPVKETHMRRYGSVVPSPERVFPGQEQNEADDVSNANGVNGQEPVEAEEHIVLPHRHDEGKCGEPDTDTGDDIRSTALF